MGRIGLALGGGGVRGLAHVLVLELLDDLGCRPSIIAGTSMGAIIGALYASGLSGKEIREQLRKHTIARGETWRDALKKKSEILQWVKTLSLERGPGGLVKSDRFLALLLSAVHKTTFEDLDIPLKVITADYWKAKERVLERGALLPALQASMAIPGVFAPVVIDDRMLVDGGVVNLVPYDHIVDQCEISIAVNVAPVRISEKSRPPRVLDAIFSAYDIMQNATMAEKGKRIQPTVWVHPEIQGVKMLDFGKMGEVLSQAAPAVEELRRSLRKLLAK